MVNDERSSASSRATAGQAYRADPLVPEELVHLVRWSESPDRGPEIRGPTQAWRNL